MNASATSTSKAINVTELVEHSPFGELQRRTFVLCLLCLVMDGIDVQALGYTAS